MPLGEDKELFLKYAYTETKDLCKHFITVVVAALVFSLTLADKVVNFAQATRTTKAMLLSAWCFMILSIITCGIGLCYNSLAGGRAASNVDGYMDIAYTGYKWVFVAGICFVLGLILLIASAASPILGY